MLAKIASSSSGWKLFGGGEEGEDVLKVLEESDRLKSLYKSFLVIDGSLNKYATICGAFAEVTGLIQEGMDQLTEHVLSSCSNTEQDAPLALLEHDALHLRSTFSSEESLSDAMSKHLLMPLGTRIREFQGVKDRMKKRSSLKKEYDRARRKVGAMRSDRLCDQESVFLAENELCSLYNKYVELTKWLLNDLHIIHVNRSHVSMIPP